ncbi:MAG: hypothetical protein KUG78_02020 [Kangiellaceae bacterium]|nr:hypothetical protein [Kangiellaceae bacterium]
MRKYLLFVILILALVANANGKPEEQKQQIAKRTEHTFKLKDGGNGPQATLEAANWLVGSWKGSAFGSQFEEVWNPPSAGSMVGMFKLFDKEKGVSFYELMLLKEENNSLSLLVKHFSADFTAWEEKSDHINFKLVKVEEQAIHFSGLSFYKNGDNKIDGYIVMKQSDGTIREEKISYVRSN